MLYKWLVGLSYKFALLLYYKIRELVFIIVVSFVVLKIKELGSYLGDPVGQLLCFSSSFPFPSHQDAIQMKTIQIIMSQGISQRIFQKAINELESRLVVWL